MALFPSLKLSNMAASTTGDHHQAHADPEHPQPAQSRPARAELSRLVAGTTPRTGTDSSAPTCASELTVGSMAAPVAIMPKPTVVVRPAARAARASRNRARQRRRRGHLRQFQLDLRLLLPGLPGRLLGSGRFLARLLRLRHRVFEFLQRRLRLGRCRRLAGGNRLRLRCRGLPSGNPTLGCRQPPLQVHNANFRRLHLGMNGRAVHQQPIMTLLQIGKLPIQFQPIGIIDAATDSPG